MQIWRIGLTLNILKEFYNNMKCKIKISDKILVNLVDLSGEEAGLVSLLKEGMRIAGNKTKSARFGEILQEIDNYQESYQGRFQTYLKEEYENMIDKDRAAYGYVEYIPAP